MKILVLGPSSYNYAFRGIWPDAEFIQAYRTTPENLDWSTVDLMVFTGGSDVTPSLYGEDKHYTTINDYTRDLREKAMFKVAEVHKIPKVGICRGGQFLNVMNGGKLHQDIRGHGQSHSVYLRTAYGEFPPEIMVTSTHHQMIIPAVGAEVFAYASNLSFTEEEEPEVVFYPSTLSLCVQYHPEIMVPDSDGYKYFQSLVHTLFPE